MQEGGEEMMTKNAVQQIEEAEHKAKEYQALAVEQAKKLLSDAERQGQAALEPVALCGKALPAWI